MTNRFIRILKDDAPDWVRSLVLAAHGDMGPDDWRYEAIEDALSAVEQDGEDAALEPDIYTWGLTRWLNSRADRYAYCDDAVNEGYIVEGGMNCSPASWASDGASRNCGAGARRLAR